ncbi:MAG: serine/threonine-protein kinase, partial [Candidatus Rokuibacteriota bacterium]
MGVVWRGRDTLLQRDVAIKEVQMPASVPVSERDAVKARLSREARAAARLSHPNAVTIFDVVEAEGLSYIVMELVDAPTLADLVKDEGPLQPERAAEVGMDVLAALEAAHREGIVHRDVKPGNVMVTANSADTQGRSKLADFGIASLKGDPKITATGMIMGSPSFMAPEQATGEESGPMADMWALGATLYYAVEGRPPFDKGQPIPTLTAVVHDELDPPRNAGALEPVIASLLHKDPARRPGVSQANAMLSAIVAGRAAETPAPTPTATLREEPGPSTQAETPREHAPAPT